MLLKYPSRANGSNDGIVESSEEDIDEFEDEDEAESDGEFAPSLTEE